MAKQLRRKHAPPSRGLSPTSAYASATVAVVRTAATIEVSVRALRQAGTSIHSACPSSRWNNFHAEHSSFRGDSVPTAAGRALVTAQPVPEHSSRASNFRLTDGTAEDAARAAVEQHSGDTTLPPAWDPLMLPDSAALPSAARPCPRTARPHSCAIPVQDARKRQCRPVMPSRSSACSCASLSRASSPTSELPFGSSLAHSDLTRSSMLRLYLLGPCTFS